MGGGGGTEIQQPTPPSAPTAGQSIEEYIKYAPQLFELQQQQAPLEAQQQLEMLQKFGAPLGQAVQDAQSSINPLTSSLQETLSGRALEGMEDGLSQAERDQFLSDFRGNLGTNAGSPIGAFETSRGLQLMGQQRQREFQNLGLSLAGRQQLAQPQAPQTTNFAGSMTPNQILSFNQGNFGSQASMFGAQAGMWNNQQTNAQSGANAFTSGMFGLGNSFLGGGGGTLATAGAFGLL